MATYKVPQDVEADDKLIGPFSFRQFIYLIVVAMSIAAAWGLAQVFLPLLIIPLPIIIFFGALALPLRKDQPMEIFLAAMVSFYLKPRKRLWDPDGIESLIEITVPKTVEVVRSKNISQDDARQRFSYLAEVVDSQGWAVRGAGIQAPNSAMNTDVFFAAQQTQDILDSGNTVAQNLDYKLEQSDTRRRQETIERVRQQAAAAATVQTIAPPSGKFNYFGGDTASAPIDNTNDDSTATPTFNPYPDDINQKVVQPVTDDPNPVAATTSRPKTITPVSTSENTPSADIINLANNADLSIQTIASEANRLQGKSDLNEEVVISLR